MVKENPDWSSRKPVYSDFPLEDSHPPRLKIFAPKVCLAACDDGSQNADAVRAVHWPLNFGAELLSVHLEFAEGKNAKIQSKDQNPFHAENAQISAVSTLMLKAKATF